MADDGGRCGDGLACTRVSDCFENWLVGIRDLESNFRRVCFILLTGIRGHHVFWSKVEPPKITLKIAGVCEVRHAVRIEVGQLWGRQAIGYAFFAGDFQALGEFAGLHVDNQQRCLAAVLVGAVITIAGNHSPLAVM